LAKAIVLGRQLTDLVVGPANGAVTFREQLNADLVKSTCLLLEDLQPCFPKRATEAATRAETGCSVCARRACPLIDTAFDDFNESIVFII
jgi:hypothetical protein